ncbi:hypothetical protein [Ketobacter sp.]|uniref:hypothetical protein n=1 Tax=Ketobacter sp. TaxID=2083498 RepID=UPI0025C733D8|nr:hypothetical protein [Ketobacter sp.]
MLRSPASLICCFLFAGCSTFKQNHYTDVSVLCEPDGAIASVNDEHKPSPATFSVVTNKDIDVSCQMPGYMTSTKKVRTHITTTGVLDAIGGFLFLVPAIGLISPGAWALNEEEFKMVLVKEPD